MAFLDPGLEMERTMLKPDADWWRGGVVVIPAFAVDRTEVVLYALRRLVEAKRIPAVPVYVDSPMAIAAYPRWFHFSTHSR